MIGWVCKAVIFDHVDVSLLALQSLCQRPHDHSACQGEAEKNMMEIPSGGALIFPLGNGSKFNWIKIILPVMFFDIVHILNLGSICNEALHCFSRMGEGIRTDSLHQV